MNADTVINTLRTGCTLPLDERIALAVQLRTLVPTLPRADVWAIADALHVEGVKARDARPRLTHVIVRDVLGVTPHAESVASPDYV